MIYMHYHNSKKQEVNLHISCEYRITSQIHDRLMVRLSLQTLSQHFTWFFYSLDKLEMLKPLLTRQHGIVLYFSFHSGLLFISISWSNQRIMMIFLLPWCIHVLFWHLHPDAGVINQSLNIINPQVSP